MNRAGPGSWKEGDATERPATVIGRGFSFRLGAQAGGSRTPVPRCSQQRRDLAGNEAKNRDGGQQPRRQADPEPATASAQYDPRATRGKNQGCTTSVLRE